MNAERQLAIRIKMACRTKLGCTDRLSQYQRKKWRERLLLALVFLPIFGIFLPSLGSSAEVARFGRSPVMLPGLLAAIAGLAWIEWATFYEAHLLKRSAFWPVRAAESIRSLRRTWLILAGCALLFVLIPAAIGVWGHAWKMPTDALCSIALLPFAIIVSLFVALPIIELASRWRIGKVLAFLWISPVALAIFEPTSRWHLDQIAEFAWLAIPPSWAFGAAAAVCQGDWMAAAPLGLGSLLLAGAGFDVIRRRFRDLCQSLTSFWEEPKDPRSLPLASAKHQSTDVPLAADEAPLEPLRVPARHAAKEIAEELDSHWGKMGILRRLLWLWLNERERLATAALPPPDGWSIRLISSSISAATLFIFFGSGFIYEGGITFFLVGAAIVILLNSPLPKEWDRFPFVRFGLNGTYSLLATLPIAPADAVSAWLKARCCATIVALPATIALLAAAVMASPSLPWILFIPNIYLLAIPIALNVSTQVLHAEKQMRSEWIGIPFMLLPVGMIPATVAIFYLAPDYLLHATAANVASCGIAYAYQRYQIRRANRVRFDAIW